MEDTESDQQSTTKYKLVIKSEVSEIVHVGRPIGTPDGKGITVAMEDFLGNQVAAGHNLASVIIELVLLDGKFFNESVWDWPEEKFEESIIRAPNQKQVIDKPIFQLKDGKYSYNLATINMSSKKRPVKLGVRVHDDQIKERVLEGVSNSFFVRPAERPEE